MKVSILVRGPIRPTSKDVLHRICNLVASIKADGKTISNILLATWMPKDRDALVQLLNYRQITDYLLLEDFLDQNIFELMQIKEFKNGRPVANAFRQYFLSRAAINLIAAQNNSEYVVHARTDMDIEMGDEQGPWFCNEYCTIHTHSFVNDQFGVAPTELMRLAWDYGTTEKLAAYFSKANIPEDVLQMIMDDAGVKPVNRGVKHWQLDSQRFGVPKV